MGPCPGPRRSRASKARLWTASLLLAATTTACSHERPSSAPVHAQASSTPAPVDAGAPDAQAESAPPEPVTPYRAKLSRSAELYIPVWFEPKSGGYDLLLHFHGLGKYQEANIEALKLNVAVVSVNLGAGTEPYGKAFKDPA